MPNSQKQGVKKKKILTILFKNSLQPSLRAKDGIWTESLLALSARQMGPRVEPQAQHPYLNSPLGLGRRSTPPQSPPRPQPGPEHPEAQGPSPQTRPRPEPRTDTTTSPRPPARPAGHRAPGRALASPPPRKRRPGGPPSSSATGTRARPPPSAPRARPAPAASPGPPARAPRSPPRASAPRRARFPAAAGTARPRRSLAPKKEREQPRKGKVRSAQAPQGNRLLPPLESDRPRPAVAVRRGPELLLGPSSVSASPRSLLLGPG